MKYYKIAAVFIFLLLSGYEGFSQQPTISDLAQVINSLKGLQTYSFNSEVKVVFPNGTRQKVNMVMCMDKPRKRLFYSNDNQTLLVTEKWAFQAYHKEKKASVFDVTKYNKKYKESLPELQEIFSNDIVSLYIDSVLLKIAKLKSAKKVGNLVTYDLSFPEDNIIKGMTIVLNTNSGLPETISMKTFQPSAEGRYNKSKQGTTCETVCRNYSKNVSEEILNPLKYFQVRGGKAYLLQYKNYQLTSIL